ncbi:MAG: VOC family protein [Saprospiraceae bacterium]
MKNTISWFEIPSKNIDRAQTFYETILGVSMINIDNANLKMRVFPVNDMDQMTTGAIVFNEKFYHTSEEDGVFIYLNANPEIQRVLDKIEQAGGRIIRRKTQISESFGYMAMFIDTEGNRIGLHASA